MTKDMTRGTPWKLIVQFALPIMAGNLLQQLYNTADTIIVGNFNSQQALSAVGSCASLTALFTALAIGFSIGAGVLISQYFGANRLEDLRRYASSSIVLMLALGLLMSVLGFCSAELFLEKFLGTPQSLLPQAALYFKIYAVGLVFQFGYNIAAAILRALGDSRATLYFLLVSSVLNVVLDLLFVAGFHMGVAGAAIATVFAQYVAGIGITVYAGRRCREFLPGKEDRRFSRKILSEILDLSLLTCAQQSAMNFGILLIQRLVDSFGPVTMAAFAAAVKIDSFAYLPVQDFGNAFSTFIAQNYGAGDRFVSARRGRVLCRHRLFVPALWILSRDQAPGHVRRADGHFTRHARGAGVSSGRTRRRDRYLDRDSDRLGACRSHRLWLLLPAQTEIASAGTEINTKPRDRRSSGRAAFFCFSVVGF